MTEEVAKNAEQVVENTEQVVENKTKNKAAKNAEQVVERVKNYKMANGLVFELVNNDIPEIRIGDLVIQSGVVYTINNLTEEQKQLLIDCKFLSKDLTVGYQGLQVKKIS